MKKLTLLLTLFLLAGCVSSRQTPAIEVPNVTPSELVVQEPTLTQTQILPTAASTNTPAALPTPVLLPASMKGYELYSWQVGDEWYFTVITGTNRNKTVEEIKAEENVESKDGWVKITVIGAEELKNLLARIPAGESVFWVDGLIAPAEFAKPPAALVDEIQEYGMGLGLNFYVSR